MAGVVFRSSTGGRTACPQQDDRPRAEGGAGGSPRGTLGNLRRTLAGDASLAQPYSREESLTAAMMEGWHEFYLLVGTSAAALTGLMFVVISISPETIAERPKAGVRAFVTPTMVFFTTALAVSALMLVPHLAPSALAALLALASVAGIAYLLWVRGHHHWREGKLDAEDWVFFIGLPFLSYVLLLVAAIAIWRGSAPGAPMLAFVTVLLLVVGIHNAWDLVIWLSQQRRK